MASRGESISFDREGHLTIATTVRRQLRPSSRLLVVGTVVFATGPLLAHYVGSTYVLFALTIGLSVASLGAIMTVFESSRLGARKPSKSAVCAFMAFVAVAGTGLAAGVGQHPTRDVVSDTVRLGVSALAILAGSQLSSLKAFRVGRSVFAGSVGIETVTFVAYGLAWLGLGIGRSNRLGGGDLLVLAVCSYWALRKGGIWWVVWTAEISLVGLSLTRSVWLSAVVIFASLFLIVLGRPTLRGVPSRLALLVLAFAAATGVIVLRHGSLDPIASRIGEVRSPVAIGSLEVRSQQNRAALATVRDGDLETVLVGRGSGLNVEVTYGDGREHTIHNTYLAQLARHGLLGAALIFGVVGGAVFRAASLVMQTRGADPAFAIGSAYLFGLLVWSVGVYSIVGEPLASLTIGFFLGHRRVSGR